MLETPDCDATVSGLPDARPTSSFSTAGIAPALLMALAILLCATPCSAQTVRTDSTSGPGAGSGSAHDFSLEQTRNEFGVWVGSSLDLPRVLSDTRDTQFPLLIGLRYGRVLAAGKSLALEYTIDLIPTAIVSQPKAMPATSSTGHDLVYGAGIIPVGFKLLFAPHGRVIPFVNVSSGPMYFSSQVPVKGSAQFNFLSTADLGLTIPMSSRHAITV
ncbi:MAG TPA: hypothetical protein VJX67_12430, partial [Blastocatellia bacterium]|nr:hypothetical protein [Blastocatellia bacterium]